MALIQGQLASVLSNYAFGDTNKNFSQGSQGEAWTSKVHGDYYNQTADGQMFSQTNTPLGLAIPIYTTTAIGAAGVGSMPIWNTSSNRNVVLVSTRIAWVSGTSAFSSFFLMGRSGMGYTAGTGSPFAAFTTTTPKNQLVGGGNSSLISSSNGAGTHTLTTLGAVADILEVLGTINLEANTGTAHPASVLEIKYDGGTIIPPGAAVWVGGTKDSVALFNVTHKWYEVPIPA